MSEIGWRSFLAADNVDDWVVLHGGAAAVFDTDTQDAAAELMRRVAETVGDDWPDVILTLTGARLTVRIARGVFRLEPQHSHLARRISDVARRHGAIADRRAVQEVQVAIAARPEDTDVGFWRAVLGYEPLADDNAIDPLGHGSTVWMQPLNDGKPLRHALHLDVSLAKEQATARVAAALSAGGRIVVDEGPSAWILADRAGNRCCITAWPDGADDELLASTPSAGGPSDGPGGGGDE